jgi:hypothetical protein
MARRRKKSNGTIMGMTIGTVLLAGAGVAAGWSWWRERGKREALEKQVRQAGAVPVTQVNGNNGMTYG